MPKSGIDGRHNTTSIGAFAGPWSSTADRHRHLPHVPRQGQDPPSHRGHAQLRANSASLPRLRGPRRARRAALCNMLRLWPAAAPLLDEPARAGRRRHRCACSALVRNDTHTRRLRVDHTRFQSAHAARAISQRVKSAHANVDSCAGSVIKVDGRGHQGVCGGCNGDLWVLCDAEQVGRRMHRKGADLYSEATVSVWAAILGVHMRWTALVPQGASGVAQGRIAVPAGCAASFVRVRDTRRVLRLTTSWRGCCLPTRAAFGLTSSGCVRPNGSAAIFTVFDCGHGC